MSAGYAPESVNGRAVQHGLRESLRPPGPFRLLFWGQAFSVIGDRITPVAIAFAVLGLGSATDLGLVMAAGGVPFSLFAPAGGGRAACGRIAAGAGESCSAPTSSARSRRR